MTSSFSRFRLNKPIAGWILYDIASSGYIMMIPGVTYAVFFRQIVCGGAAVCDGKWAFWVSLSLIVAGALAPLLGAIADIGALRHRLFVVTTLLCGGATLALGTVQPGAIVWGGIVFLLAQTGYLLATSLYDAYLPSLVPPGAIGRLSSWGWGLGYLGGIACYLLFWLVQSSHRFDPLLEYRLAFAIVGLWLLLLSLPALAWLPHQSQPPTIPLSRLIRQSYHQVWHTLSHLQQNQEIFKFLVGFYLISDGIVTLNNFLGIYLNQEFGLSVAQILHLGLLFNLISIPSTILFGLLSNYWSLRAILSLLVGIWTVIISLMLLSTHPATPLVLAVLMGLVFGSTQSLCRGWFAQMIQANQATELFGFNALAGRMSSIFGPLLFGGISTVTGNQRLAVISLLLSFGLGGLILSRVRRCDRNARI
ncbi:MFS transporter [Microcystis aeruginosa CS-564/01]|uniref:MFS transporter n=1 Tax=Microcystis aeruginosa TaxID=1126 RepID=UPI00232E75E8|nr:MFS transporter [Microcystis aeruginosa]MDB9424656.1 MFS transporter [Microcystis aeruginosa CS-564/01]